MEPTTWQQVVDLGKKIIAECPFETMLWYPGGGVYRNEYVHNFRALIFHWIPAYLIDFLLLLLGRKQLCVPNFSSSATFSTNCMC